MLGGALTGPGAESALRFAVRGRAAREQLECVAAQVVRGRAFAAREDELDAVAGGEIGQLGEMQPPRKLLQRVGRALLIERELGQRFAAVLSPRDADEAEMFEQARFPRERTVA